MNRVVYLGWAIVGALVVLSWWAAGRGDSRFARLLLSDRGPSAERAPRAFLTVGAVMAVLLAVLLYSLVSVKAGAIQTALLVLMPFLMFPAAMGLGGGLYLLLRRRFSNRRQ
jgi:drug/metabolite transporter (DMT)-like permease